MVSCQQFWPLAALVTLLSVATMRTAAASTDMVYCASINTASTSANFSTFQSDGLCYEFCIDDYAFAIVQENNCWCSNYVPATHVDINDCDTACPGYPSDTCGGDDLWGYMSLDKSPSGTSGAATATTAATTTKTKVSATDKATTKTPNEDSTTTAVPSISVATITQGGSISYQTVTVVPTATPVSSDTSSAETTSSKNGLSTGQAVGVAVGVLGGVLILAAIGVFMWLRRKRLQQEADNENSTRGSSAGMMSTPQTEMASVWDGDASTMGRRNSRLMPHDPRMDPYVANIYTRFDNKSQESVNTLRDDHDYSRRVLRTTNPDPNID
ncbi:uncharacterized protein BCR38DRAFT_193436 [Pseudomassariella vexata]|uniref:WSC domain-containing protein n=1 Tax=Pseudomassariella vexata TaxID=1141098 RepID=A0A1Y2E121_9PEZI|nr:uncharacterized protein BCR38DRAFT_193436 [Pseudomassariella vexata]ORY65230.1 hypothetical protein BCR38DRAFT_193436 [Pseudomassariella vexata]